ncbi:MAG: N-acetylmuramoyl-L-alanine amidase [Candidatus Omnitrophica bacterium]|nr:N-acetylmuramoyl-L-alanine amidase [Candidatus Omnitrophota bacterium]
MIKKLLQLLGNLSVVLFAFLITGCATVKVEKPVEQISAEEELRPLCDKYNLVCKWDGLSQSVSLKGFVSGAKMIIDSDIVIIGDKREFLDGDIKIRSSKVYVPGDFKSKVVDILIKTEEPAPPEAVKKERGRFQKGDFIVKKVNYIIIDAGHGGKDPGAISRSGIQEKGIVLDIAQRLEGILREKGFRVSMTRDSDKYITLQERTTIASSTEADLFISIHANASLARKANGVEVYTLMELGLADKYEEQRKINHSLVYKNLDMAQGNNELESIVSDMYYSNKQSESQKLAKSIISNISRLAKSRYRGIKEERYFVLRNTLIPAVLVEVGFLSNQKESVLLGNKSYRQKLADSIAKGIIDYVHQ